MGPSLGHQRQWEGEGWRESSYRGLQANEDRASEGKQRGRERSQKDAYINHVWVHMECVCEGKTEDQKTERGGKSVREAERDREG